MNDFLNDLYCAFLEDIRPPKGYPEHERTAQAYISPPAVVPAPFRKRGFWR